MIANASSLAYYDVNKPTTVGADASSYSLGAVLLQEGCFRLVTIAFASRSLSDTGSRLRRNVSRRCGLVRNFLGM